MNKYIPEEGKRIEKLEEKYNEEIKNNRYKPLYVLCIFAFVLMGFLIFVLPFIAN